MKHLIVASILTLTADHSASQVSAIPKIVRGAESVSDASKAARVAKVGSKWLATESTEMAVGGSEKLMSAETKALIATRTAQVITSCKSSSPSDNKDAECKKRSNEFQRCIASELEFSQIAKTAIDRCTRLFD